MNPEDVVFERSLHTVQLLRSHLAECKRRDRDTYIENIRLFETMKLTDSFQKEIRWYKRVIEVCNRDLCKAYEIDRSLEYKLTSG